MLPHETNPGKFIVPPNHTVDDTNALVYEENQIDVVIFNHLDAQGNLPAVGTLLRSEFRGIGMAQNIPIQGKGPFWGVQYEGKKRSVWSWE